MVLRKNSFHSIYSTVTLVSPWILVEVLYISVYHPSLLLTHVYILSKETNTCWAIDLVV